MSRDAASDLQPRPILQSALPAEVAALAARRLPGIAPLALPDWLIRDEAFAPQMALRDRLLSHRRRDVLHARAGGSAAARELLALIAGLCARDGYRRSGPVVNRPDGVSVRLDADTPLATAARLVQEDLLILDAGPDGHVLREGALLFPSNWTLAEKIGRPLAAIHDPVPAYDSGLAPRVQRLFDAIRPNQPLIRANRLGHADFQLFQPRREADPQPRAAAARYTRAERQCLLRLPETGAVVFSIHSFVIANPPARGL